MARGKYATKAAKTRDVNELSAQIVKLTNENRNLNEQLRKIEAMVSIERGFHVDTVERLREENRVRTNGEIEASKEIQRVLQAALDAQGEELKKVKNSQSKILEAWLVLCTSKLGMSRDEAFDALMSDLSGRDITVDWDNLSAHVQGNPDVVKVLQKVRHKGGYPG